MLGAAVIVGGDLGHTVAPLDDPGWSRVGRVGTNGSGVYLGNGWVLTANHVTGKTNFVVQGDGTYTVLAGAENTYRVRNPEDTQDVDLYLFRVGVGVGSGLEGLPMLSIATALPGNGSVGMHIGTGEGQTQAAATTYHVDTTPTPWVWGTEDFAGADWTRPGYSWAGDGSRGTRWNAQVLANNNLDFSNLQGFATQFIDSDGFGMASDNDSGSPYFLKPSGWELAGIAISLGFYSGQPGGTGVIGNLTLYADLTAYRSQILAVVIPEASTFSLALVLGGTGLCGWGLLGRRRPPRVWRPRSIGGRGRGGFSRRSR